MTTIKKLKKTVAKKKIRLLRPTAASGAVPTRPMNAAEQRTIQQYQTCESDIMHLSSFNPEVDNSTHPMPATRVPDSKMAILHYPHYPLSIMHYILRFILLWIVWRTGISLLGKGQ